MISLGNEKLTKFRICWTEITRIYFIIRFDYNCKFKKLVGLFDIFIETLHSSRFQSFVIVIISAIIINR